MALVTPYRSFIAGAGAYLPEKILSNKDLEKLVETNDAWITERTGIKERRIAADDQACSDLAYEAAIKAMDEAKITAKDIDMIIVATTTPDQPMPSTGCVLQAKLGCENVMAFDMTAACSGFVYAATVADQFIRTGMYKNVLICGSEIISRVVDYEDRQTCILFGDGAGAWVMSRSENEEQGMFSSHMHSDGSCGDLFQLLGGGSRRPISHSVIENKEHYVRMKGKEIFRNAVRTMVQCCHEALDYNKVAPEEIDWVVPHQANHRILESVAKHFGIGMDKVIVTLDKTGNTSAATIPLAFDKAREDGKIKRGDLLLFTAFGAGITSGSFLMRY